MKQISKESWKFWYKLSLGILGVIAYFWFIDYIAGGQACAGAVLSMIIGFILGGLAIQKDS